MTGVDLIMVFSLGAILGFALAKAIQADK